MTLRVLSFQRSTEPFEHGRNLWRTGQVVKLVRVALMLEEFFTAFSIANIMISVIHKRTHGSKPGGRIAVVRVSLGRTAQLRKNGLG